MTTAHAPQSGDMIRVQGNREYLPVAQRVQWFRGDHPTWTIGTALLELDWSEGYAVLRAEVIDDTGRLISSGIKTETRKGFGDFVEKAETGAVGRALARAGYGTEDALDLEGDRYADAPIDQPQDGERASGAGRRAGSLPATTRPAAQRSPEEQALIGQLLEIPGMTIARMTLLADAVGVPKGGKATADQLREMLDRAETPASGVPSAAGREGGGGADRSGSASPSSEDTPHSETHGSESATPEAGDSPPVASPPAAPTDAEILAAAGEGAEIVPPRPATDAYKALSAPEKAAARAYWQRVDSEPQQETLAEALGAPTSD